MKIKVNECQAGVMTLKDGIQINYGVIRVTQNLSKLIFYTGKGLRDMFKPAMTEEEEVKAEQLKKLDEKTLMKFGYVSEMAFSNIQIMN
jgi:hypothetical protein